MKKNIISLIKINYKFYFSSFLSSFWLISSFFAYFLIGLTKALFTKNITERGKTAAIYKKITLTIKYKIILLFFILIIYDLFFFKIIFSQEQFCASLHSPLHCCDLISHSIIFFIIFQLCFAQFRCKDTNNNSKSNHPTVFCLEKSSYSSTICMMRLMFLLRWLMMSGTRFLYFSVVGSI